MPEHFEFADLNIPDNSEYHRLLERCPDIRPLRFRDGEYLTRSGDLSKEVFVVLRGSYVVEQPAEDPRKQSPTVLAAVLTEDEANPSLVGEMAYLGSGFRTASVRSTGWTYTLCLKPEHLNVVIEQFPVFTRILCRQFAERLRQTSDELKESRELFTMQATHMVKEPGEVIFSKGERADTLYQLLDGAVVREAENGQETLTPDRLMLGFLEPLSYFLDQPYPCTVRAKTSAWLVAIAKESRLAVIRKAPQLALECLRGVR